jgi:hypothetical protein
MTISRAPTEFTESFEVCIRPGEFYKVSRIKDLMIG